MKSGHVIDGASRARQLTQFFRDRSRERNRTLQTGAQEKLDSVMREAKKGDENPGVWLSHSEIKRRLSKLNPSLVIRQSIAFPDRAGIYIRDGKSNLDDVNLEYRGMRMVTSMSWGIVPENSVFKVETNEKGDPDPHIAKKGWRTTLANLISLRLITLAGAERMFGSGGEKWHERLH